MTGSIIVGYLVLLLAVGLYSRRKNRSQTPSEYFLGGRQTGFFVLAMTISATYISASSYISGPGAAYTIGLPWVFLASVQYPVILVMTNLIGQKIWNLGRQFPIYDLPDYFQHRYQSVWYTRFSASVITFYLFLILFIGISAGSRLLESTLRIPLWLSILIFVLVLGLYTLTGGFRAVLLSDVIQGLIMLTATVVLSVLLWNRIGGVRGLELFRLEQPKLFQLENGPVDLFYLINSIFLVGFGTIVNPMNFTRLLSAKSRQSLRKSTYTALAVTGLIILLQHFNGFAARTLLPSLETSDQVIGKIVQLFPSLLLQGLFISALLSAILSSTDSTLNTLELTFYRHFLPMAARRPSLWGSRAFALLVITAAGITAVRPPDLLAGTNLFALLALQIALFWPLVFGFFVPAGRARDAAAASIAGLLTSLLIQRINPSLGGMRSVIPAVLSSACAYLLSMRIFSSPGNPGEPPRSPG